MILSTVAVVLAGGTSLTAQVTTGALNGKLTDSTGKPVAGAKITMESSALFNPRVVTTDARGDYRALLLPVGDYTLKVSAQGFLAKTATNVRVGVGSNLTMSFVLNPLTTASQTVEVVSDLAAAAKTDDKISTNFSAEKLMQLPTGQGGPSFAGALGATPGVQGSWAASATTVRGGETNQVMYRINGINVKDDTGAGALYEPLPDSIEDVQVVLTALNARFGSVSGGQVNVVTKSGSNEFEGTIRNEFSRSSWAADQRKIATNLAADRSEKFQQHTDIVVSGPIIKDRLWFYVGTRFQPSKSVTATLGEQTIGKEVDPKTGVTTGKTYPWEYVRQHLGPGNTYGAVPEMDTIIKNGPTGYSYTSWAANAGDTVYGNIDYKKYDAKLTGAITDAHLLSATYLYEKTTQGAMSGERRTSPLQVFNPAQAGTSTTESKGWTLNWNGTLASNWTVEARISSMTREQSDVQRKAGSYTGPSTWNFLQSDLPNMMLNVPSTSWMSKEYWYFNIASPRAMSSYNQPEKRGNGTYSVNVTTFQELAGQHQIDFGFQRDTSLWNFGRARAGSSAIYSDGVYVNTAGDELYPTFYRTPLNNGSIPANRNGYQDGKAANGGLTDPIEATVNDPGLHSNWPGMTGAGWAGATTGQIWGMADRSTDGWRLGGDIYTQWGQVTSVGTHLERNWIRSQDEKNSTDAFYVNDSWTINSKWNVMIGARYNKMELMMYGKEAKTMNVFEPRAMVKFNPDGNNKNIFSLSYAKLSQVYSDKMANYFRGNEWTMQSMQHWTGAALDTAIQQHGFDSVSAQNDVVSGTHNGYTYDGVTNMHGIRFVDYQTLTNFANYSTDASFKNRPATCDISDLRVPYALEANLGFQHNFSQGWFKINAVQRQYKDRILGYNWAAVANFGKDNWKIINSPVPGSTQQSLAWKDIYRSSTQGQTYRSVEFSFDRQLTSRWDLTGAFTLAYATGKNEEQYYQNISIRQDMLTASEQAAITPDTVLTNDKFGYLAVTYVQPVGKGNISLSTRLNYANNGGYGSLNYTGNYQDDPRFAAYASSIPKNASDAANNPNALGWTGDNSGADYGFAKSDMNYTVYYGSAGQYRTNFDTYTADLKLNADLPIYKKLHFIGYVTMSNIFNAYQLTNMHTAMSNMAGQVNASSGAGVYGRAYQTFDANYVYGKPQNINNANQRHSDYNWGNPGRQVTNVSIGLKF